MATQAPKQRRLSAKSLGIEIQSGQDRDLFKWFVASFLFGKHIQQEVARHAYQVLVDQHGCDSPKKLARYSWQKLVDILGEGHYVRYDESMADRLLKLSIKLNDEYGGKVGEIHNQSKDRAELKKRLEEFNGVGPKTVEIFMREARKVWT
jgi:endonuclease III